ncbi:hypothetical protein [Blastococcus brunescens]|uniref:Uncharacterized protein n=1 Tax=Blastococcus brunescens TaxID=1564165 RepID=A0ABZ1B1V8_9ACTN|nr:hypothetical protein [Blastococcus sp. BMG 8361]WRL64792.1 hypothetical protein U6N30_03265 [Blastococcus sp. BMG 8361]
MTLAGMEQLVGLGGGNLPAVAAAPRVPSSPACARPRSSSPRCPRRRPASCCPSCGRERSSH